MLTWQNRHQAACDRMFARGRVVAITQLLRFGLSQTHGRGGNNVYIGRLPKRRV